VIEAAAWCKANSFLGKLSAVAQLGNGKVKLLIAQNLHLDPVLRRHRRFAALLNPTVQGDGDGGTNASVPGVVVLLSGANWLLVGNRAPTIIRNTIRCRQTVLIERATFNIDRIVNRL
tara:strand:- start:4954 stop:5307 length:354 start_codon:yes stop_codon:yes gene_type:complete